MYESDLNLVVVCLFLFCSKPNVMGPGGQGGFLPPPSPRPRDNQAGVLKKRRADSILAQGFLCNCESPANSASPFSLMAMVIKRFAALLLPAVALDSEHAVHVDDECAEGTESRLIFSTDFELFKLSEMTDSPLNCKLNLCGCPI